MFIPLLIFGSAYQYINIQRRRRILIESGKYDKNSIINTYMICPLLMKVDSLFQFNIDNLLYGSSNVYYTKKGQGIKLIMYNGSEKTAYNIFVED